LCIQSLEWGGKGGTISDVKRWSIPKPKEKEKSKGWRGSRKLRLGGRRRGKIRQEMKGEDGENSHGRRHRFPRRRGRGKGRARAKSFWRELLPAKENVAIRREGEKLFPRKSMNYQKSARALVWRRGGK